MYYEFYMDVFFVVNLVMDVFLLCLVKQSMGSTATSFHILAGALLGAAGMCGAVWVPFQSLGIRMVIAHGILGVLMVKTGCRLKTVGEVVQGIFYLYVFSFFTGGTSGFGEPGNSLVSCCFHSHLLGHNNQQQTLKILKRKKRYPLPGYASEGEKMYKSERSV